LKTAAVIGAGIAGIAASIRLAVKGYDVTVFEANGYAGGKLSSFDGGGYRFDAGPSLFTMPQLVEDLFILAGRKPNEYFEYIKLSETCRYFWDDGTSLTAHANQNDFANELQTKLGEPAQNTINHLTDSAVKYDVTEKLFLHRSLHKLGTYFNRDAFKGYANAHRLEVFKTMNQANERRFKTQKAVQLFNRYATYNGSDPYQTPATMNIIPHLEYNIGAFFPVKGMVSITESLLKLAQDLGVKFRFETKVTDIMYQDSIVTGLKFEEQESEIRNQDSGIESQEKALQLYNSTILHLFNVVISNMDVVSTFKKLLPTAKQPERILRQPKSSSALIFYWGIKAQFSNLGLHNIFFSDNYQAEFEAIFNQKTLFNDPTVYVNITSKHKPDDAPDGCENWFVMVNAPNNDGQDWDSLIASTRQNIIDKLNKNLGQDISQLIDCEQVLDPRTIESRTSSSQGALYGNSSNNRFAAFLRHANFSSQFRNLYFVGGSVHPGGGIPLCLLSAKIATDLIK
jgi:phytoene desaturase